MVHQDREHRGVAGLAGADEHDQRQTAAVDEMVDLGRQATTGPADSVVRGFLAQIPVVRQVPPCAGRGSSRADGRG